MSVQGKSFSPLAFTNKKKRSTLSVYIVLLNLKVKLKDEFDRFWLVQC